MEHKAVLSNDFIKGELKISLLAFKIFLVAVNEIDAGKGGEHDNKLFDYKIPLKTLMPIFNIPETRNKSIYNKAKLAVDELLDTQIRIKAIKKYGGINLVSEALYDDGYIYIGLNERLKPYTLQMEKNFTQLPTKTILEMKSIHSVKIFTLLCMKLGMHKAKSGKSPYAGNKCDVKITMEELRLVADTKKKYPRMLDFKKRVLEPAIEEINNCSNYHLEISDQEMDGKSISAFIFTTQSSVGYIHECNQKKKN